MNYQFQTSFQRMVTALAKDGEAVIKDLTPLSAHNLHMAVGVCGEAGELLDAVKKYAIYVKPLDRENVVEELGDLEFYMEGLRQGTGITREETLAYCEKKLAKRYGTGHYGNAEAQLRADKAGTIELKVDKFVEPPEFIFKDRQPIRVPTMNPALGAPYETEGGDPD